jgi:hypothetical protein
VYRCRALPRHTTSYHVIPRHSTSYHVIPRHVTLKSMVRFGLPATDLSHTVVASVENVRDTRVPSVRDTRDVAVSNRQINPTNSAKAHAAAPKPRLSPTLAHTLKLQLAPRTPHNVQSDHSSRRGGAQTLGNSNRNQWFRVTGQ